MCAPKDKGGKRCLKHQAGTAAETRFVEAKTGVSRETIYETLKELNKEGRKLDAPALAEVKEFINKEQFIVNHDPELSERDRKLILKNLDKARQEAEKQGVTGGAFHAWKNLFSKTVEKIKKPALAVGLIGALSFSLAGCSGSMNNDDVDNTPNPTTSTGALCDPANDIYGDVIAKDQVKDERGEYCHVAIDPNAEALKRDDSKITTDTLTPLNITADQAYEYQKKAVEFFGSEGVDSTVLDNNPTEAPNEAAEAAWYAANQDKFDENAKLEYSVPGKLASSNIVINGYTPKLVRDGAPRVDKSSIVVNEVYGKAGVDGIANQVVVNLGAKVTYRATDEETVAWKLTGAGATEESVKAEFPELFDGKGENTILVDGKFAYSYSVDSGLLVGNSFTYDITYSKGAKVE